MNGLNHNDLLTFWGVDVDSAVIYSTPSWASPLAANASFDISSEMISLPLWINLSSRVIEVKL